MIKTYRCGVCGTEYSTKKETRFCEEKCKEFDGIDINKAFNLIESKIKCLMPIYNLQMELKNKEEQIKILNEIKNKIVPASDKFKIITKIETSDLFFNKILSNISSNKYNEAVVVFCAIKEFLKKEICDKEDIDYFWLLDHYCVVEFGVKLYRSLDYLITDDYEFEKLNIQLTSRN